MIKKWLFSAESELFLVFSAENSAKMLVLLSWNDKWIHLYHHFILWICADMTLLYNG